MDNDKPAPLYNYYTWLLWYRWILVLTATNTTTTIMTEITTTASSVTDTNTTNTTARLCCQSCLRLCLCHHLPSLPSALQSSNLSWIFSWCYYHLYHLTPTTTTTTLSPPQPPPHPPGSSPSCASPPPHFILPPPAPSTASSTSSTTAPSCRSSPSTPAPPHSSLTTPLPLTSLPFYLFNVSMYFLDHSSQGKNPDDQRSHESSNTAQQRPQNWQQHICKSPKISNHIGYTNFLQFHVWVLSLVVKI